VTWLVMKQPMTVSSNQLTFWRTRFTDNIRPPQKLQGRVVQESW
jgi:carbonic anhydrase